MSNDTKNLETKIKEKNGDHMSIIDKPKIDSKTISRDGKNFITE